MRGTKARATRGINGVPAMRDALSNETGRVEFTHPLIVNSYYSIILRSKNV